MQSSPNIVATVQPTENHTQVRKLKLTIRLENQDWPESHSQNSYQHFIIQNWNLKKKKGIQKLEKWSEKKDAIEQVQERAIELRQVD